MAASDGAARQLTIGFIPLVDSAPLAVAKAKGFAGAEGLTLTLVRETSWANIRDRVMVGHFEAAHMLGPLPIAASLGIGQIECRMLAPFAFGLGGNAVTVSTALWEAMRGAGVAEESGAAAMAKAIAAVVAERRRASEPPLTFGMVYPFSAHNYELRYWLASAGIDPDRDVRLHVLPPPFLVDALEAGQLDGFCVGEPWNSIAVDKGIGRIVTTKSEIWRQGPEKVLGLRADWAERNRPIVAALLRALDRAAHWCDRPENHAELAEILARPEHVGADAALILRALQGRILRGRESASAPIPDFLIFHRRAANFPWRSHALWFYSQMVRWGQTRHDAGRAGVAAKVYRPDIYRAALAGTEVDFPSASAKVEGALAAATPVASSRGRLMLGPDGFFDGKLFDPDRLDDYIAAFGA